VPTKTFKMQKLILFFFIVFVGCNNEVRDNSNRKYVSPPTPFDFPQANLNFDSIKTRKLLGQTGYSILISDKYSFQQDNDSTYSIGIENTKIKGTLSMKFYDPQVNPERKVAGSHDKIKFYTDTICNTVCDMDYYSAFELSIIDGDILDDYRIRCLIVTKNKDGSRPELIERNKLYGILKSLQKEQ
jgi:hypothetical protein